MRQYSFLDRAVFRVDKALRFLFFDNRQATRASPANEVAESTLTSAERRHAAGLMRVNHVGEVCAQALYRGQSLSANHGIVKQKLQQAAQEEFDHLSWCQQRLEELGARTSYLNPVWYASALLLGFTAGCLGDKVSLGFLAATEHQVSEHLLRHLNSLPCADKKSRAIVHQMQQEEVQHALTAEASGAVFLPPLCQWTMRLLAKFMTSIAYRV